MAEFILPLILFAVLTGAYLWLVWKFPPAIFMANVTYSAITKIVSCLYIELNPIYLIEMGIYSGPTGATLRQLAHHVVIYAGALFVLRKRLPTFWGEGRQFVAPRRDAITNALLVAAALCAVQFLNVLSSPNIPLFGGNMRQVFWNYDIRVPLLRDLIGVLMVFVPCIASYGMGVGWALNDKRILRWSSILLAMYFAFLLVSGQKFHGLMVGVFLAVGPFYVLARASGRKVTISKWGARGLVAVLMALSAGVVGFGDRGISQQQGGAAAGLLYRAFAMQGTVYYAADKLSGHGVRADPNILYEGMEETIRVLVPPRLAELYLYSGVELAGSLPGNSTLVVGFWATFFVCGLYGMIFGFVLSVLIRGILEAKVYQLFLLAYVYMWTVAVYSGGSFDDMLSLKYALFVLVLVAMEFSARRSRGGVQPGWKAKKEYGQRSPNLR